MARKRESGQSGRFIGRRMAVREKLFSAAAIFVLSMATATTSIVAAASPQLCQIAAPTTHQGPITNADRLAAAERAAQARAACTASGAVSPSASLATPDYFGTTPNYANSPLPTSEATVGISGGGGTGAAATAEVTNGSVTAITVTSPGSGYTSPPAVSISGGSGAGAVATATVSAITGSVTAITVVSGGAGYATGGIRKFVDSLPGLNTANDLGQSLPVAVPDTTSYPGSDYYEIAVVQYRQKLSKDLPATLLRGYVQLETPVNAASSAHFPLTNANLDGTTTPILKGGQPVLGYTSPQYLGPTIIAERNVPTRVKFTNLLPTGVAGDLFIPVDTTVMGAGGGPIAASSNAACDPMMVTTCATYSQNRATLHLHGGVTPWISDGTPNEWITPAGEDTKYPKGISVTNVPDMPDPGPGSMTFFYTNQQSARLMFYHDHAYGITRLNVYAGEAAGYILQDSTEAGLVAAGQIPADQIPLVIQDKTFVPGASQLAQEDPTWNTAAYGGEGNLWMPHVYMPNQNPADSMGVNAMGRWDYGPWFWPPNINIANGAIANPLVGTTPSEGPTIPGTPNPSITPEAFMDTPLVNGTAYPFMQVGEKAYRLRILNASNDRTLNLQLYCAASNGQMWDANGKLVNPGAGEVPMVSASTGTPGTAGYSTDILDGRDGGVPDQRAGGPTMTQIGTEGGFLPSPVALSNSPVGYTYNRRDITVLNVSSKNLMLGPAERADVIVDFSQVNLTKCSNIILYNDAPAPVPAFDPRYDYYTGDPDQTSTGGAPTTIAGYGPNTRTIMQFQVTSTLGVSPAFNTAPLTTALPAAFGASQDQIIVPEAAYSAVYGQTLTNHYVNIADTATTFTPLNVTNPATLGAPVTIGLAPKAIQELFEIEYGRMNATLGVELPNTTGVNQTTVPLGYAEPYTEEISPSDLGTQIGSLGDGTQIWKITHNGVDTHAIHFHLFNVQLINRVGWDGMVKPPDPNELGWKETVRMNPLEDAIVALRPVEPKVPFGVPDSIRPVDVTRPTTATINTLDPLTGGATTVLNTPVNLGWEYVWHCHLLGHEENDMMRPVKTDMPKALANAPVVSVAASAGALNLSWTDGTPATQAAYGTVGSFFWGDPKGEVGYRVERAVVTGGDVGAYANIGTALANHPAFVDPNVVNAVIYSYRVTAFNAAGDSVSDAVQATWNSTAPSPPLNVAAVAGIASATVTWSAPTTTGLSVITGYTATASGGGGHTCSAAMPGALSCVVGGLTPGTAYRFTVTATNGIGTGPASSPSNSVIPPAAPAPPTGVSAVGGSTVAVVRWLAPLLTGGLPITGYTVTPSGSGVPCTTTGALTCTVTGLTNGTPYTFTVTATNSSGTGGPSGPSNSVTPAPTVPDKPTGVAATAGAAAALVSWIAPANNGGSAIIHYTVTSSPGGQTCTTSGLSCAVGGLTNGTTYKFTVTATNTTGTGPASDPSAPVTPGTRWSVTLGVSAADVTAGTAVTLIAQANQDVTPSPYYLVILANDGSVVGSCAYGTTCTVTASKSAPTSVTYTAFVGTSTGMTPTATSNSVSVTWTPAPSTYFPLTPTRVLDTATGTGLTGYFNSHVARTFQVTGGTSGVPANATAVTGNLTVTGQSSVGFLYLGPVATDNPTSSTLNFPVNDDRANGVTVALGAGGTLAATYATPTPGQTTHVIFDVTGYFTPDATGAYYFPLAPTRLLNTVTNVGLTGSFSSHLARTFQVTGGTSGVPANATAVTGNLTVTGQTSLGFLYVGPVAVNDPTSSTLNFPFGDDRANGVTVALGAGGTLSVTYAAPSLGPTAQVIFDVTGYFSPDTSGAMYLPLTPTRILDSRDGTGGLPGAFSSHLARTFQVTGGTSVVPANATAVTGNLTVTSQGYLGFLYIGPVAINDPTSSSLNFPFGDDRANSVDVALGAGGTLSVTYAAPVLGVTAQVIFDVTGYFVP